MNYYFTYNRIYVKLTWSNKIIKGKTIRVNTQIKSPKVRLIGTDGRQIGILDISEALNLAKKEELDLVEISPAARPPVCKIMDFGRFKYKLSKKEKGSKKKQHIVHVKEIRFRPKTEKHDFDFKVRNARKFIEHGNKLKVTVIFKGREVIYQEFGMNVLKKVEKELSDIAKTESQIKKEGKNLIAYFIKK